MNKIYAISCTRSAASIVLCAFFMAFFPLRFLSTYCSPIEPCQLVDLLPIFGANLFAGALAGFGVTGLRKSAWWSCAFPVIFVALVFRELSTTRYSDNSYIESWIAVVSYMYFYRDFIFGIAGFLVAYYLRFWMLGNRSDLGAGGEKG